MSGFVAVIAHDAAATVDGDAGSLCADYVSLRGGGDVQSLAVSDWARVAWPSGEHAPTVVRDGEHWRVTVGRHYEDAGGHDGQFATIAYDPGSGELHVITDPFGMQAVYIARRAQKTYVSTCALAIARHLRATPDPLGVQMFLRTGVQYGPVTHWRDIRRVAPATVIRLKRGASLAEEVHWVPEVDERIRGLDLAATVDACVEAGLEVVGRRMAGAGELSADLTGGYDSRLVCALLDRTGSSFHTLTAGESGIDSEIAEELATAASWPWRAQTIPSDWDLSETGLQHALGWGDATLDVFNMSEILWRQLERSGRSRTTVTGGGGENFGPSPWLQELHRAGRSRRVNFDNLMEMRQFLPLDVSVMRIDPRREVEPYVREVLAAQVAPYGGLRNTTQLDVIHAYREVGHFGAYRSAGEAHVTAQLPCYFRDFWSVAFSAHHRHRNGHRLHRGIIERLHPVAADVRTERGGPAALMRPGNAMRFAPYHARMARTVVRKLRRRPGPQAGARPATQTVLAGHVRRLRDDGALVPRTMRSGSLYDATRLERMVDAAASGGVCDWTMLGRIVTVELALRQAHASL